LRLYFGVAREGVCHGDAVNTSLQPKPPLAPENTLAQEADSPGNDADVGLQ